MGGSLLRLKERGIQAPHWHVNSSELNYCLSGNAKMTIYGNAQKYTFTINPGQLTFVPKGYWHDIENIGNEELKVILVYDNERPQDIRVAESVHYLPKEVLNSIFGLRSTGLFNQLETKNFCDEIVVTHQLDLSESSTADVGIDEGISNPYTINLLATDPQVQTPGGIARLGSNPYFPILIGLSVFVIDLAPRGIIEPHTHPNAGELNYVIEGKVRFTILGPIGEIETNEMVKGQVFFVPAGYFHYLENSDSSKRGTVASFFSNESPQFIGLVGGLSSYSNVALGAMFNKESDFFNGLPRLVKNVLIAAGTNQFLDQ
ncbi:MAG TPA: cupin domain-containing protein, partial [Candidatus Nitrosocosmicus sp.]|nr:cupin domain-containing protein [Candidatus Nitrosocosmicus sp.]